MKKIPEQESAAAEGALHIRVLGIVLAGGKGTRRFPLTRERAKGTAQRALHSLPKLPASSIR